MNVRKCDFCKKEIDKITVTAGFGVFARPGVELCEDCGAPVLKFLRKNKVIDKNNKEIKSN